jgi:hypothetical protein
MLCGRRGGATTVTLGVVGVVLLFVITTIVIIGVLVEPVLWLGE